MKVLLIGSGGREHAMAWKLAQSDKLTKLYCAPSNAGINQVATPVDIAVDNIDALAQFALDNKIDLTIVGPEYPLSLGIVDQFEAKGLKVFGPDKKAAQLEASKIFAKDLLKKYNIPTAAYETFNSLEESLKYIDGKPLPYVVKYDGLAAGKGVTVCLEDGQAEEALKEIYQQPDAKVVIEDFLKGQEVSLLAICDGNKAISMIPAQDYKPAYEGNAGPNTGGMGSYAPSAWVSDFMLEKAKTEVIEKTLDALKSEGITFKGVLYAGLIITANNQLEVLEFNCRFGDPETQAILPLLEDDLLDILYQASCGNLEFDEFKFKDAYCVSVVMASGGYPKDYEKGKIIKGLADIKQEEGTAFHAGTKLNDSGAFITAGGRVMNLTAIGPTLSEAAENAYKIVNKVTFDQVHFRKDIAQDGILCKSQ